MAEQTRYEFKAEIKKLLNILSQSLYQHPEIFLRELISNASDALKKIHILSLEQRELRDESLPEQIDVHFNADTKTLIVSDNGIGMTREELISNLGTIASSGSQQFLEKLKSSQEKQENKIDLDIIGQFGVGFYSVFMIAEKVEVISRSYLPDAPAYRWISDGSGEFEIESATRETRGTDVILYIKPDQTEFLAQYRLESIIKKYSNFVPYPIYVKDEKAPKKTEVDVEDEVKTETPPKEKGEVLTEEKPAETTIAPTTEAPKEPEKPKPVNELQPLWKRPKTEIKDEDYRKFYQFISNRYDNYGHVIHYNVDGQVQFKSILYIPETRSQDLLRPEVEYGLTLYSKNVMIMQKCKELIPQWARFISGIVDSDDIPLNISRETIQTNRLIMKIEELLVKKIISEFEEMIKADLTKYHKLWKEFGPFIKEGVVTDYAQKDRLVELLRFQTSKTKTGETIGLSDYIKKFQADQKEIYYLVGENLNTIRISPHLGYYNQKGIEVLFLTEPIDNFLMMNLHDYRKTEGEGEAAKETVYQFTPIDVTDKSKKAGENKKEEGEKKEEETPEAEPAISEETKKFLEHVNDLLKGKIIEAKVSTQLYNNICRLANPKGGMTSSMQRVMRYWSRTGTGKDFQIPQKILEFNAEHPVIKALVELYTKDPENKKIRPIVYQLFENSLLAEGDLPDPSLMVPRVNQIIEMLITGRDDVENLADTFEIEKEPSEEPMNFGEEDLESEDLDDDDAEIPPEEESKPEESTKPPDSDK